MDKEENTATWAQAALQWLRVKEISGKAQGSAMELVEQALKSWVNRFAGDLKHLTFSVLATYGRDSQISFYEDDKENVICVGFHAGVTHMFTLQGKLGKLYETHALLAETALYWLGLAGCRTLNIATPWMLQDKATYLWWGGTDNHEDFVEEMLCYGHDENEIEEMIGPADWEAAFPEWVHSPSNKLSVKELRTLAGDGESEAIRNLAETVADIAENGDVMLPDLSGTECDPVYFGAMMRWNGEDVVGHLLDDWFNTANQGADCYAEMYGVTVMPIDPFGFRKWKRELEAAFTQIRNLDRLIDMVAEPFEERG